MDTHEEQFLRRRIDLLESENARLRKALDISQIGHDAVMHDMWLATVSSICKVCREDPERCHFYKDRGQIACFKWRGLMKRQGE